MGLSTSAITPDTMTAPASGERELAEQHTGQAAEETNGQVDGDQSQRHRDDRQRYLPRADQSGIERLLTVLDVPVDVFDDNDRVVHDEPYGNHHRQQRQKVDGKPHEPDEKQDSRQRQRDGHDRNHHHRAATPRTLK